MVAAFSPHGSGRQIFFAPIITGQQVSDGAIVTIREVPLQPSISCILERIYFRYNYPGMTTFQYQYPSERAGRGQIHSVDGTSYCQREDLRVREALLLEQWPPVFTAIVNKPFVE